MDITYTISLTVTRSLVDCDPSFTMDEHCEAMESQEFRTRLEREVIQALRKIDGDCDCEVMETKRVPDFTDEPQNIADTGVDTWSEYRCER